MRSSVVVSYLKEEFTIEQVLQERPVDAPASRAFRDNASRIVTFVEDAVSLR